MVKAVLLFVGMLSSWGVAQVSNPSRIGLDRVRVHHASPVLGDSGKLVTQTLSQFSSSANSQVCTAKLLKQIDQELKEKSRNYRVEESIKSIDIWVGSSDSVSGMVYASTLTCRKLPRRNLWYIASRKEPKIEKEGIGGWIDELIEVGTGSPFSNKSACDAELKARKDKNYLGAPSDETVVYVEVRKQNGEKVKWRAVRPKNQGDKNYLSLDKDCDVSRFNLLDLLSRSNGLLKENYDRAQAGADRSGQESAPMRGSIDRSKPSTTPLPNGKVSPPTETRRLPLNPGHSEEPSSTDGQPED